MSWDLGEVVIPTPFEVRVSGVLTAATVTLTVTAPDGTVSTPAVTTPSTGVYTSKVPATQAGDWRAVWSATGAVDTQVLPDQWYVEPLTLRILSMQDARDHLQRSGVAQPDDGELRDTINAITAVIEHEVGPVVVQTFTETVNVSGSVMVLGRAPAISLTSVTAVQSSVTAPALADLTLEPETGLVYYTPGGLLPCGRMRVTYTAGRAPIPDAIRQAAKITLAWVWEDQHNRGGGRPQFQPDDITVPPGMGFALPNKAREFLAPYTRGPAVA